MRHSEGKAALAQLEDLGAIESSWDAVRAAAGEAPGVGKARAVVMSSASAWFTRCENMASALGLEVVNAVEWTSGRWKRSQISRR